jgi:osmoprotectant transport system ATP-binding protein
MIQLQNVSKLYEQSKAVDDISFEVKEGETVVLLGTSGCGKTTTLRMINRLAEPSSGNISIAGKNIQSAKPEVLRRGIGYVLQHTGLFPHYTIEENISMVPKLVQWPAQKIHQRTTALLEKFKLEPSRYSSLYPHQLSGGQQQRVGLARALAADPPILLMDEPFGALDPITRAAIRKEFKELDEFKRKTVLLVTHDVQEAFELADRICLMNAGKIVQSGTPMELLFQPASDFVRSFLHEQHFLLELQTVTILDVWKYLQPTTIEQHGIEVSNSASLWDTLQLIVDERKTFDCKQGETTKTLTSSNLMTAFQQYKSSIA